MSKPPTKKPAKAKTQKIKRVSALIRFPPATLERLDILAAGSGLSRNDTVVEAVDNWKLKPVKAPEPEVSPPIGSRLDKTTIGKRVGPKKGSKPPPVDDGEEGV